MGGRDRSRVTPSGVLLVVKKLRLIYWTYCTIS
nr:MAG TPA: hypothetical protein [Caudoviricetes sp.]